MANDVTGAEPAVMTPTGVPTAAMPLPVMPPTTLLAGRYRVCELLGSGGMSLVYRAEDERLNRFVAIKVVRSGDPDLVSRLRTEATLLARLTHPNIVRIYDIGEDDGRPFVVTELVDGPTLHHVLRTTGLTAENTGVVTAQLADALAAAHTLGIVHRDLKPSNVIVPDARSVQLLDFGIARHIDDTGITQADMVIGTASYLSPEQLHGQRAGPPCDVYALGLVAVECFTRRPAFPGTFAESLAARVISTPTMGPEVPAAYQPLLLAMTDTDPSRRPTAREAADRLLLLSHQGAADEPTVVVPPRAHGGAGAAGAAAAGALAAGAVAMTAPDPAGAAVAATPPDDVGATSVMPATAVADLPSPPDGAFAATSILPATTVAPTLPPPPVEAAVAASPTQFGAPGQPGVAGSVGPSDDGPAAWPALVPVGTAAASAASAASAGSTAPTGSTGSTGSTASKPVPPVLLGLLAALVLTAALVLAVGGRMISDADPAGTDTTNTSVPVTATALPPTTPPTTPPPTTPPPTVAPTTQAPAPPAVRDRGKKKDDDD